MEVAEELASMVDVQRLADFLAFNEDLNGTIFQDGVINLFAFFVPISEVNSGTTSSRG